MNKLTWKKIGWSLGAVGALAVAAACSSSSGGGDGGINCGTGSTQCGDTCTVVARDSQNCGACGKACAATELCSAGTCVPAAGGCTMGTTKCGTECVDTKTDDRNCGMCGTKCGANKVCMAGACADNCAMGTTKCGNSCVDQQTDRTNCGGCGTTCKDGEICSAGKCAISCQQGLTKCSAPVADGGVADAAADASSDGGSLSGDYCANLQSDTANCGTCGKVCSAAETCVAGTCKLSPLCGNNVVDFGERCDGAAGVPAGGQITCNASNAVNACKWNFANVTQLYCNGSCSWGGAQGCDQADADIFCKLKTGRANAVATAFTTATALAQPGFSCPNLGTNLGVVWEYGAGTVWYQGTSILANHGGGTVINSVTCN